MDTNIQIQSLKSQIENIKLQIDNIQMQNSNIFMMNNNSIGEQMLFLSIQLLNAGIQAFNTGKNLYMMMNMYQFYDKLRKISEQINSIINENNLNQIRDIQQQMIMQNQIHAQQQMMQQEMNNKFEFKNIVFQNARCPGGKYSINIVAKIGTTVEDVLNQYMIRVYGTTKKKIYFLHIQQKE